MCLILGLVETVEIRLRISKGLWEVGELDVGVELSWLHRRLSIRPGSFHKAGAANTVM